MPREQFQNIPSIKAAELLRPQHQPRIPLVIGGIGTESAIPYMRGLLRFNSDAKNDQDHIAYREEVATSIPDRSEALKAKAAGDRTMYEDIARRIYSYAKTAKTDGFDFFVTICNTIHAWREDNESGLKEALDEMGMPWVSIMESAAEELHDEYPQGTKVGVFATDGTLMTDLYENALQRVGLVAVQPEVGSEIQKGIMDAIYNKEYGIKAKGVTPKAIELLLNAAMWAEQQNIQVALGACTEIPLALNTETYHGSMNLVNPLDALARKTLKLSFDTNEQF